MEVLQTDEILTPSEIESVGFLLEENEDHVTICRDIVDGEYRGQLSIPRENILCITQPK